MSSPESGRSPDECETGAGASNLKRHARWLTANAMTVKTPRELAAADLRPPFALATERRPCKWVPGRFHRSTTSSMPLLHQQVVRIRISVSPSRVGVSLLVHRHAANCLIRSRGRIGDPGLLRTRGPFPKCPPACVCQPVQSACLDGTIRNRSFGEWWQF